MGLPSSQSQSQSQSEAEAEADKTHEKFVLVCLSIWPIEFGQRDFYSDKAQNGGGHANDTRTAREERERERDFARAIEATNWPNSSASEIWRQIQSV